MVKESAIDTNNEGWGVVVKESAIDTNNETRRGRRSIDTMRVRIEDAKKVTTIHNQLSSSDRFEKSKSDNTKSINQAISDRYRQRNVASRRKEDGGRLIVNDLKTTPFRAGFHTISTLFNSCPIDSRSKSNTTKSINQAMNKREPKTKKKQKTHR